VRHDRGSFLQIVAGPTLLARFYAGNSSKQGNGAAHYGLFLAWIEDLRYTVWAAAYEAIDSGLSTMSPTLWSHGEI